MQAITITEQEKSDARSAGFKRKRPKLPKSKTETSYANYVGRYNDWARALKEKAKAGKSKRELKDKFSKLRC